MFWERFDTWEEKNGVVLAYKHTESREVKYVVESESEDTYYVQYWPDYKKQIETVSLLHITDSKEDAVEYLENEVD